MRWGRNEAIILNNVVNFFGSRKANMFTPRAIRFGIKWGGGTRGGGRGKSSGNPSE